MIKNNFKRLIPFYAYEFFTSLYICVLHKCLAPTRGQIKGYKFTHNWSYGML